MGQTQRAGGETADVPREGAFSGNSDAVPSEPSLLDLVHLSCQTFGDPALERDVLTLFLQQAQATRAALEAVTDTTERARLCHLIKGSARGVGAFDVALHAQNAEDASTDAQRIAALSASIDRTTRRIEELLRR